MISIYKKDEQWFAEERRRISNKQVEVLTVPVSPEQAIMLRMKLNAEYVTR